MTPSAPSLFPLCLPYAKVIYSFPSRKDWLLLPGLSGLPISLVATTTLLLLLAILLGVIGA
jgi:hypothetical protein